jgi:L-iditol 2-dehydrogenase
MLARTSRPRLSTDWRLERAYYREVQALRLAAYDQFELVDLPSPELGPEDVLVRVRACGICGSDVHGMDGSTGRRIPPIVMGHEAAGEITEVGSTIRDWAPGDRVTFDSTVFCGRCEFCQSGRTNLCVSRQVLGVSCAEYRRDGAFAEFVALPARGLYRAPEAVSFAQAAMAEPISVALHAVRRADVRPGESVAVIGAGMIGQFAIQVLVAVGARVTALEPVAWKRALAERHGAASAAAPTADMAFDAVIEAVGITATVATAVGIARKGGRVALVGNFSPTVDLPLQAVVTREIDLRGCCAAQSEYEEALRLIESGAVRTDSILSAQIPLADAPSWFARLRDPREQLMKVVVCP